MKKLPGAITRWHQRTEPPYRTIENLKGFLKAKGMDLPIQTLLQEAGQAPGLLPEGVTIGESAEWAVHYETRFLVTLLIMLRLPFDVSTSTVDALVRPNDPLGFGRYGYEFFLSSWQEHPWLLPLILKDAEKCSVLRLQVRPAFPAGGEVMTWLYDPWSRRAYQLRQFRNESGETGVSKSRRGVIRSSTGLHSQIVKFDGPGHPFAGYQERLRSSGLKLPKAA